MVKIDHFCCFSDIMGVYNKEYIDMNPLKSCQTSCATGFEYQRRGILALIGLCRLKNGLKRLQYDLKKAKKWPRKAKKILLLI